MTSTYLTPYLNFNGNCREAMEFYKEVLGGELEITTFADMPMGGTDVPPDGVMHSVLKVNDTLTMMASEAMPGTTTTVGDNVHLTLGGSDEPWLTDAFNDLAVGGKIDVTLAPQPWGDTFGMLTDKFGVHWMVNITAESA